MKVVHICVGCNRVSEAGVYSVSWCQRMCTLMYTWFVQLRSGIGSSHSSGDREDTGNIQIIIIFRGLVMLIRLKQWHLSIEVINQDYNYSYHLFECNIWWIMCHMFMILLVCDHQSWTVIGQVVKICCRQCWQSIRILEYDRSVMRERGVLLRYESRAAMLVLTEICH